MERRVLGTAATRDGRFHVADPEQVKALTLAITYRGGVVVYVNGREVARGHLPAADNDEPPKAGAVTSDTLAPSTSGRLDRGVRFVSTNGSGVSVPVEHALYDPEESSRWW